jgi:hypothetical protein
MLAPVGMTYQRVEDRESREQAQRRVRRLKRKHKEEPDPKSDKQGEHIDIKV